MHMLILYMYILWNDYHSGLVNISITHIVPIYYFGGDSILDYSQEFSVV